MSDPYEEADPFLLPWARRHGLTVDTVYKDDRVRSVSVWSVPNREPAGQDAQLWITPPDARGSLEVHVAVGTWHHAAATTLQELSAALDAEYSLLLKR